MLSFAAQKRGLEFISDISPEVADDLVVLGDPGRVRQIITNLLTNSIKFTHQGFVKLSVAKERETDDIIEIRFMVQDTGIGIDEGTRKRLFQPFSQGDASTARKFGGTGLGLTICKSLLELMRGRIQLDSVINQGTTAYFWVPFNKPHETQPSNVVKVSALPDRLQSEMSVSCNSSEFDQMGTPPPADLLAPVELGKSPRRRGSLKQAASEEELASSERSKIHVLVVEDNPINQQIAIKTIKKLGFNVSAAWNGKEALEYLATAQKGQGRKPDIILMVGHLLTTDNVARLASQQELMTNSVSLKGCPNACHRWLQSDSPPAPPLPLQRLRPRCAHCSHDGVRYPRGPREVQESGDG